LPLQAKVITDRRRDIQSGTAVGIQLRLFIPENVLKIVRSEWPAILPLRVTDSTPLPNRDPTILANGLPRPGIGAPEPRNEQGRFGFKVSVRQVVVRQGNVKRILPRGERHGNVIAAIPCFGRIISAIIRDPVEIPRASLIRDRIIRSSGFADPKYC